MEVYFGKKLFLAEQAIKVVGTCGKFGMGDIISPEEMAQYEADGWEFSKKEDGYIIRYADGYEHWLPRDVFEKHFDLPIGAGFDLAIQAVKIGARIARRGWNGKGMYVFLAEGQSIEFSTSADMSEFNNQEVEVGDMLVLRTAQGTLQPGWLATQSDILADDWYIVLE